VAGVLAGGGGQPSGFSCIGCSYNVDYVKSPFLGMLALAFRLFWIGHRFAILARGSVNDRM
jgi:hypothetical protein